MKILETDLAVIGSGPAGQKAAIQANKLGKKAVVIEKDGFLGGACLNSGTIPSKTLREAILVLTRFHEKSAYGEGTLPVGDIEIRDLNHRLQQVLEDQRDIVERQFCRNGVIYLRGTAHFEDKHTLIVTDQKGENSYKVKAEFIIIATGSKPRHPIDVPFDGEVVVDSSSLLNIKKIPKSLVVLGGGVIGAEYASLFAALGTEVTVVDKRGHILPMLDREIGLHLQDSLTRLGMTFIRNAKPSGIKREGDQGVVILENGLHIKGDVVLHALGRRANVEGMQLDKLGIVLDKYGYVSVNDLFQTERSNIYAVGDVIGGPSLASTSMEQGRLAARHAFGSERHYILKTFPIGIWTIPEISSVGATEEEVKKLGFRYEIGRSYYYEIARGHIAGAKSGIFKIIFHAETLEILGIHIIGRAACELIHIGQVAMSFNVHLDYFIDHVFNYPTFAEGYRIAALNGYNKIKHVS